MQALILAAGRGSRMGQKSSGIPKCLLEVGRRFLIEHQLEALSEAGVGPIAMVLGYCADEIREVVGIRAEYIENPRWQVTNSLCSFYLAREWVKGGLIIMNSDIMIHPQILNCLLSAKGDAFAYDSSSGQGREHMKVMLDEQCLVKMSKDLPQEQTAGENVGVLCLTGETVDFLFKTAGELIAAGEEKQWLGIAVSEIAKKKKIKGVDISGLPWGEIDFSFDLERVRKEVWPKIEKDKRKPKRKWQYGILSVLLFFAVYGSLWAYNEWWIPPKEVVWVATNLPVDEVEKINIYRGQNKQKWWLLKKEATAVVKFEGPGIIQIDSRLALEQGSRTDKIPYVLKLSLDNNLVDWYKKNAKPFSKWKHKRWKLTKRERIELNVGAGQHQISILLIAIEKGNCIIRARQKTIEDEED